MKTRPLSVVDLSAQKNMGNIFFLLLYPTFFFYHSAIGLGLIPATLGGFFTPVAIIAIAAMCPILIKQLKKPYLIDLIFLMIIIYWCSILALYILISDYSNNVKIEVFAWSARVIIANFACYIIARHVNLESKYIFKALLISLAAMFLIALLNAKDGFFYLRATADSESTIATYQGFGRSAFVVSALALALCKKPIVSIIIFSISITLLFLNGARSEFVFFLLVALMHLWLSTSSLWAYKILACALLLTISLVGVLSVEYLTSLLPETRMLQLLDISESSSGRSRSEFASHAWATVQANPILGSYAEYVPAYGIGGYAHNIISAWADLGLVGFALYCIAVLMTLFGSMRLYIKKPSTMNSTALLFSTTLLFAFLFSKGYTDIIFGLTVGLYSNARSAYAASNCIRG